MFTTSTEVPEIIFQTDGTIGKSFEGSDYRVGYSAKTSNTLIVDLLGSIGLNQAKESLKRFTRTLTLFNTHCIIYLH